MVTTTKAMAAFGIAAALVLTMGSSGHASGTTTGSNYLTFSRPVALPGVELRAGTYIFERALPDSSFTVVRVLSTDRRTVYLLAFTNTVNRPAHLKPGQAATLGESRAGTPPAVLAWYPIDGSIGHAFIYR